MRRPDRPLPPRRCTARNTAALLSLASLLASCAMPWRSSGGSAAVACERLPAAIAQAVPGAQVQLAQRVGRDELGHPAHCRVQGALEERRGQDGQRYAIGFELRLPANWNGRFLHQANGGTDGVVKPAYGSLAVLEQDALTRGFAVLSSDGGHVADDPARAEAGLVRGVLFGQDAQARRDFAYAALDALWPLAQTSLRLHYGRAPQRNYLAGCGNGGRLGLVAASRWPERWDGILAGAPALHWPGAALQHPWDQKLLRRVDADPRRALSPADMQLLSRQVLARCDALDGATDGMVGDLARCQGQFRLAELQCSAAKTPQCLSAEQVHALAWMFTGPHDSTGRSLYTDWLYDAGLGSAQWRRWRLESDIRGWEEQPIAATMGAATLAHVFSTPPQPVGGSVAELQAWLQGFHIDQGAAAIRATAPGFSTSAQALMSPPDVDAPDLARFAARRGRLIVYHGASDPAFSVQATLTWTERLQARWGQEAAMAFARTYAVPGMGHCQGGPATDRFDALAALQDWVEKDTPPQRLLAQVNPANSDLPPAWRKTRTRPLCAWPLVARHSGGDQEAAASFQCVAPPPGRTAGAAPPAAQSAPQALSTPDIDPVRANPAAPAAAEPSPRTAPAPSVRRRKAENPSSGQQAPARPARTT